METFTEELKREYFSALYNQLNGVDWPMQEWREKHRELYNVVNAMYHKRKILRENIKAMKEVSKSSLVFGALTYDNEHNEASEEVKRHQAVRYLNHCFDMFLFVEEYGTDNGRYHIHFVGVLKPLVSYSDFHCGWHSRSQIEKIISVERSVNYLTDYVVKQVPRIRRNKKLVQCFKHWQKANTWDRYKFKESFGKHERNDAEIAYVFDL